MMNVPKALADVANVGEEDTHLLEVVEALLLNRRHVVLGDDGGKGLLHRNHTVGVLFATLGAFDHYHRGTQDLTVK